MNRKRKFLILLSVILLNLQVYPQLPYLTKDISPEFNRGLELYRKEKYPASIRLFDSYLKGTDRSQPLQLAQAEYYSAMASLKLFNGDGEYKMLKFIANNPESPFINEARLSLGDYFYQNKSYRKSITYYESVNRQYLDEDQLAAYFFKLGYSHYMAGEKSRALLMFSEIKDVDTEYTAPATYYFSHIAYEQKMYETAMDGFMRLKDDETFGGVVPFYIVQILYIRQDYDKILEMAPGLIESAGRERETELYRFIGDAHYKKGNYREAIPYLEKYAAGAKASGREDKYELAYCYYKTGDTDKATKLLLEIGAKNDLLSQNIWNLLGDCYIQKGDKKRAQFAFGEASKMNFDRNIKEESLFNFAKLTYETGYSPFGEAIAAFEEYIEQYPGSERVQDAYDYLVATYMQLRNYKAALASLDKIQKKDSRLEEAYQRVAFYRGLELYKNVETEAAVDMFEKSLRYGKYNREIRARSVYWRGESYYRLGRHELARADYELFLGLPGIASLTEYTLVRYNLGYTLYNQQQYPAALNHFRTFEASAGKSVRPEVLADTKNRIADCYFMSTDYKSAISYYDKVVELKGLDSDYATYQKGFSLGLTGNEKGKIDVMTSLTRDYPSSTYVPDAIYERGRAYVTINDLKRGESDFNAIISDYPNSQYVPKAMLQLGLLYFNSGENEKALAQYRKVIENYKSTTEARSALTGMRNTYVEMNEVEKYFAYVKTLDGYGDVNMAEKDSLLFASGESLYMSAKYDKAAAVLKSYRDEFPNGSSRSNATFYLAECYRQSGQKDEALELYLEVCDIPNNQFIDQALEAAANIYYDKEDYTNSLLFYERLGRVAADEQARLAAARGELSSAYQLGDAEKTISASRKIAGMKNVPEEVSRLSTFLSAKAHYSLNNFSEALPEFRKVAREVTTIEGAESKFRVAELLNRNGQVAEAEKVIAEFIDMNTPHQYWMARVFLLLADISIKKGDTLQARATLQSLKEYYTVDDDGILDEVREKLSMLDQGTGQQ
ncbi:MAG: tetratricopeptide repeat protein [Bacteroidales bacterium]|nr:tetratricopeptide repeat protein [Bacteroidales bacterium]